MDDDDAPPSSTAAPHGPGASSTAAHHGPGASSTIATHGADSAATTADASGPAPTAAPTRAAEASKAAAPDDDGPDGEPPRPWPLAHSARTLSRVTSRSFGRPELVAGHAEGVPVAAPSPDPLAPEPADIEDEQHILDLRKRTAGRGGGVAGA